jgi:uncharacterized protein
MTLSHRRFGVVSLLALVVTLAACGGKVDNAAPGGAEGGRLTIATGNTTGVYYILGGGLAKLISTDLPGYSATAEATKASKENIERIAAGQNDIAFSLADTAADAVAGTRSFTKAQPVKALMRIYDNTTQVIVRADSGIASIADMRGKTISTGSANSGTEVIATRLLEVNGLKPTDITQNKAALDETVDGMKDGSIKGMFWSGGLPTAGVKDLLASLGPAGVKFLDLSADLPKMQQAYGAAYRTGTIPAAAYGTGTDVPTILVANVLMVNEKMSDKLAGDLVKLVFAKKPDLEKIHPEAKNITLDQAALTGDIPLHPGADKALTELGAKRK